MMLLALSMPQFDENLVLSIDKANVIFILKPLGAKP